jgi:hypothetical protein
MTSHFDERGNLPAGIHRLSWDEILRQYGYNFHRGKLLNGLNKALHVFKRAGCKIVYLDGSFVTAKQYPNDYDCCWKSDGVDPNLLDRVLLNCSEIGRKLQKIKYYGEFFPSSTIEKSSGSPFLDFFQTDAETDEGKGIVEIDLERLP